MRDALLAAALLVSVAAGVRAVRRAGWLPALFGAALSVAAFGCGRFLPGPAYVRGLSAMYAVAALGKTLALGRATGGGAYVDRGVRNQRASAAGPVLYLVAYPGLDPERAFARDPSASRAAGAGAFLLGGAEVAAACALAVAAWRSGVLDAGPYPAAWARAASFALLLDGLFRGGMGLLRALGFRTEEVFRAPWMLSELAEFWGRRWNRFVSRTLGHEIYAPVKRRAGRLVAVLAAFVVSGVLHDALFGLAVGFSAWRYTLFFAIQGVAIVAEAALLPGAGRTPAGRFARWAFAWVVLLATAPWFFGGPYPDAVPLERTL